MTTCRLLPQTTFSQGFKHECQPINKVELQERFASSMPGNALAYDCLLDIRAYGQNSSGRGAGLTTLRSRLVKTQRQQVPCTASRIRTDERRERTPAVSHRRFNFTYQNIMT
jgi:hypothetical protein